MHFFDSFIFIAHVPLHAQGPVNVKHKFHKKGSWMFLTSFVFPVSIKGKGTKQQSTKIPKITLRPIPLHAHFEKVLALPRDCVTLQRNLAYFSPITDTRQPKKTQCFTRIPALQSHACCSTQAYQQWLAQCCRPFDSLLHSTLLKSTCSTLLISTLPFVLLHTSSHITSSYFFSPPQDKSLKR